MVVFNILASKECIPTRTVDYIAAVKDVADDAVDNAVKDAGEQGYGYATVC